MKKLPLYAGLRDNKTDQRIISSQTKKGHFYQENKSKNQQKKCEGALGTDSTPQTNRTKKYMLFLSYFFAPKKKGQNPAVNKVNPGKVIFNVIRYNDIKMKEKQAANKKERKL